MVGNGSGITTDNLYNKILLTEELLKEKLSFAGTVIKKINSISNTTERTKNRTMFAWRDKITLLSYFPKTKENVCSYHLFTLSPTALTNQLEMILNPLS